MSKLKFKKGKQKSSSLKFKSKGPHSKSQHGGEDYVTDTVRTENIETGGFRGSMTSASSDPYTVNQVTGRGPSAVTHRIRSATSSKGTTGRMVTAQNSGSLIFTG